ncbi:uncharacterized protein LOC134813851 isoform X2 [Bolinopsis microptera]
MTILTNRRKTAPPPTFPTSNLSTPGFTMSPLPPTSPLSPINPTTPHDTYSVTRGLHHVTLSSTTSSMSRDLHTLTSLPDTTSSLQGPQNLVWKPNISPEKLSANGIYSETADLAIASLTVLLILIGLIGNSTSLVYFWQQRKKAIHPKLYTMICAVDICSCITAIPVIISLFNSRTPVLFEDNVFCATWTVAMTVLLKLAMFLVMIVSVTRTIAMTFPLRKIRADVVIKVIIAYMTFICFVDVVVLSAGWFETKFKEDVSMCEIRPKGERVPIHYVYSLAVQTELLLSSVLVFSSFAYGTFRLVTKRSQRNSRRTTKNNFQAKEDAMFVQVTVTIAIFTAVFLMCNLPGFILQLTYFLGQFAQFKVDDVMIESRFLWWYSHIVFYFFCGLLNAAINPFLYFSRMPNYRNWTTEQTLNVQKMNRTTSTPPPSFTLSVSRTKASV